MALSNDNLKGFSFGYLTGGDLIKWCSPQLLIKQYEVDNSCLQAGCDTAISELTSYLRTKYDPTVELSKIGNILPTAVANIASGSVTTIDITVAGNNFTSAPQVNIVGGGGNGADADAVLSGNAISQIIVLAGGLNYTTMPYVSFSGGQTPDTRYVLLVKLLALMSVRNILGSMQNISDKMKADFEWVDTTIRDIRKGQMNLLLPFASDSNCLGMASTAKLIHDSFQTLG
jgi:hypothetical protein